MSGHDHDGGPPAGRGRLGEARARAAGAADRVRRSERVAATNRWAGGMARRARSSDAGQRATALSGAAVSRMVGGDRADGRPGPVAATLWLILGLLTMATTFRTWLHIEIGDQLAALPLDERIPRSLLQVADRGYSAHEVFGLGTVLAVTTLVALGLGLTGQLARRWYWWLLAGVAQLVAGALAVAGLATALLARSAVERLMPEEWAPYSPEATLASGGPVYLVVATAFGVLCWVIAFRSRRWRRRREQAAAAAALPHLS